MRTKILIVEDDVLTRQGYVTALAAENFNVFEAPDGLEGLKIANRERPDLILLDVMMPIMDGVEMLKKLRTGNDYEKKVPVVILSNLAPGLSKVDEKIPNSEPVYYILKADFSFREVVKKIEEILSQNK